MARAGIFATTLLLAAALASACSERAPAEHAARVERVELRPLGAPASAERAGPVVVATLRPPASLEGWRVYATEHALGPVGTDASGAPIEALVLSGPDAKRIDVTGRFDARTFDRVRVTIHHEAPVGVRVALGRTSDGRHVSSSFFRIEGEPGVRTCELELRDLRADDAEFELLTVRFAGKPERVGLVEIALVRHTWSSLLPDPAGPAAPVLVGAEWRPARALAADAPLAGTVRVPPRGVLRVPYGLPESVRRAAGDAPALEIVLARDGAPVDRRELALEAPGAPAAWHEATLELGAHAGAEVRVELAAKGSPEIVLAVGEPRLVSSPRAGAPPPTVVLVTSDTHRADHLGAAARSAGVRTPFLDALAARGVLYENCWSAANVTNPSHVALFTGVTPRETGVLNNVHRLDDAAPTLAEAFRDAGYLTWAVVSAAHLGPSRSGLGQGFDRVNAPMTSQRDGADTIAELVRWLPDADGAPLFVWLHLFDAHAPYEVPEPYQRLYYPADRDPYDATLPGIPRGRRPTWNRELRDAEWLLAQYKSQITYLDERLAELFAEPRLAGAITAITADHGEMLDEHLPSYGHTGLYVHTLHVPLVLAWPGGPRAVRSARAVRQIDVGRTLLDLAGLETQPFPGRDLVRDLDATDDPAPRFAIASGAKQASVQSGRWLLVLTLDDELKLDGEVRPRHAIDLYDVAADPDCRRELADEEPERAAALRRVLVDWLAEPRPPSWRRDAGTIDSTELAELAALGYADADEEGDTEWIDPACACEACAPFQ